MYYQKKDSLVADFAQLSHLCKSAWWHLQMHQHPRHVFMSCYAWKRFHTDVCTFQGSCRCNVTPLWSHPSLSDHWYVCLLSVVRGEAPSLSYVDDLEEVWHVSRCCWCRWLPAALSLPCFVSWSQLALCYLSHQSGAQRSAFALSEPGGGVTAERTVKALTQRHFVLLINPNGNQSQTCCNYPTNSIKAAYFPELIKAILSNQISELFLTELSTINCSSDFALCLQRHLLVTSCIVLIIDFPLFSFLNKKTINSQRTEEID